MRSMCRTIGIPLLGLLLAACLVGCAGASTAKASKTEAAPSLIDELDALTRDYADRYVLLIATACDNVESSTHDPKVVREVHALKARSASSMYDMATEADPQERLLNMIVAVTLQSTEYIDEDAAAKRYGEKAAAPMIRAMRQARIEVWDLGARVFSRDQLEHMDHMISEWRRLNPEGTKMILVRFADIALSRQGEEEDKSGGGFLAPLGEARRSVDAMRLFSERAFYYAKRAPLLLTWQAQSAADELLGRPEVQRALDIADRLSTTAATLPATVEAERKNVLSDMDARRPDVERMLDKVHDTIAEANEVIRQIKPTLEEMQRSAQSVEQVIKTADAAAKGYLPLFEHVTNADVTTQSATQPSTQSRPFDIREYAKTLAELTQSAKELNTLVISSGDLLNSPAWNQRMEELQKTADDRVRLAKAQSEQLVDEIFHRIFVAIGVLFLVLVAYRTVSALLIRWLSRNPPPKRVE